MSRLRRTPALPLLGWSVLLGLLAGVSVIAFDIQLPPPLLLGGAAVAALLLGLGVTIARPGPEPALLADPETSAATVWLAASVALLALSAVAGIWLTLVAGGMVGVGIGGVLRELGAQRRALEGGGEGDAD